MGCIAVLHPAAMRAALVVAAVLAAGCPHGGASGPPHRRRPRPTPKDVVTAARGAIEQWRQAYEVRSVDALAKLYAHDPDIVLVLDGSPLIGWRSVEAMLKDRLSRADEIHIRLKDVQVASLAPTAAHRDRDDDARHQATARRRSPRTARSRSCCARPTAGWLIVAEHYSYKRPYDEARHRRRAARARATSAAASSSCSPTTPRRSRRGSARASRSARSRSAIRTSASRVVEVDRALLTTDVDARDRARRRRRSCAS